MYIYKLDIFQFYVKFNVFNKIIKDTIRTYILLEIVLNLNIWIYIFKLEFLKDRFSEGRVRTMMLSASIYIRSASVWFSL